MNLLRIVRFLPKQITCQRRAVTPGRATVLILLVVVSILYLGPEINNGEGRNSLRHTKQYQVLISLVTKNSEENISRIEQKAHAKTDLEKAEEIEKMFPNLPMVFWQTYNNISVEEHPSNETGNSSSQVQVKVMGEKKILVVPQNKESKLEKCGKFPNILDLHYNNLYWQQLESGGGTFLLYAAYLDTRRSCTFCPMVRVLGMVNRVSPSTTFCQLWLDNQKEPVVSKVFENKLIWQKNFGHYHDGIYLGYMLGCKVPEQARNTRIVAVSVVEHECDQAHTLLKVLKNETEERKRKKFAVCVKGFDFVTDISVRLVEWIELLAALGVDNILSYELSVHPNVSKVLNYYKSTGFLSLTPHSLAGHQPNLPMLQHWYLDKRRDNKRQNEVITYNDCFYRNMYKYEYIALLDVDEVIIPNNVSSWGEMINEIKKNKTTKSSHCFRHVYFLDDMSTSHEQSKAGVLSKFDKIHVDL
jgi:hypothetical protein